MISLIAAALTFTATATGVDKGTPVEFLFVGKNSDRDYEAMFVLTEPVSELCNRLEKAGLPRGKATNLAACRLWPVGCKVSFTPAAEEFVDCKMPEGVASAPFIYTGGERDEKGELSDTTMPNAACAHYTLAQPPIVLDGIYDQGMVYGAFTAKETLKKGCLYTFSISWDAATMPTHLDLTAKKDNAAGLILRLRREAEKNEVDATIGFDGNLTVEEATAVANAVAAIDSPRVKINGVSNIFYRAFQPLVKWRDRSERLVQPFELTIGDGDNDTLVFIDEDWTVDGDDPKLTPREIAFADAAKYPRTNTCFIFAAKNTRIERVLKAMDKLKDSRVMNWYIFQSK